MSLPRLALRAPTLNIITIRTAYPGKAKIQFTKPFGESGFLSYGRNWSRDPKLVKKGSYIPPQLGNLPSTFLVRRLPHAYELYPLVSLLALWLVLFGYTVYYSFSKVEIFLDKSTRTNPGDWERVRETYWQKPTLLLDPQGLSRQRNDLLETLEDEMLEAAKKRGTRP